MGVSAIYRFPKMQLTARRVDAMKRKNQVLNRFCEELRVITTRQVSELGGTFPSGMGDPPSFILTHKSGVFFFYYQTGMNLIVSVLFARETAPEDKDALPMVFEAAFKAYSEHMQKGANFYSNIPPPKEEHASPHDSNQ